MLPFRPKIVSAIGLVALLCVFTGGICAQVVLGGSVDVAYDATVIDVDGVEYANTKKGSPNTFQLRVVPRLGYCMNENYQIGLRAGVRYHSSMVKIADPSDPTVLDCKVKYYGYDALGGLYARRRLVAAGPFAVCLELNADASLGFSREATEYVASKKETKYAETAVNGSIAAYIVPVLCYAVSEHCMLDLWVDALTAGYRMDLMMYKDALEHKNVVQTTHNWYVSDALEGLDIDRLLGMVSLGLTYKF